MVGLVNALRPLRKEVPRRAFEVAKARLEDAPVVVLGGPRSVGKSTLLAALARDLGQPVLDLDDPATRRAVEADPARFLDVPRPVLVDEYARVPESLDVVKALLNQSPGPGQFVLAGSTRYGSIPAIAQALTGRALVVPIWPLSQGEIAQHRESFLERLIDRQEPPLGDCPAAPESYAARVVAGGMPIPLSLPTEAARRRWFEQYLQLTLDKDVAEIRKVRRRVVLPRLATALAARTAQLLNVTSLGGDLGLDRSSTEDYVRLLEAVFLHHVLPAWGTTLSGRTAATPKVHFVDTGLAARLLRVTADKLLAAKPSALQQFGHLLETFTVNELCKQAHWLDEPVDIGHWRTHDGQEVDLVMERPDGSVLAFEVKASTNVRDDDARGIRVLARRLGPDNVTGFVMHTGTRGWRMDEQTFAVPIANLWGG